MQSNTLQSANALLNTFALENNLKSITSYCEELFLSDLDLLQKTDELDKITDSNGYYELNDILFDLMMFDFLSTNQTEEDYFDSLEWAEIEEKTIDRGTELLNLFLYITEAKEHKVEISIEDFLNEFLFVDTDENQDEFKIYEPFIKNDLNEIEINQLKLIKENLTEENPIKDFFIPMVLFFQNPEESNTNEIKTELNSFEFSVLNSIIAFNK